MEGCPSSVVGVVHPGQPVVVDGHAVDATGGGEDFGRVLELLSSKDPAHRALGGEQRVAVQQLEVAGQLLHAVDLAAALDLHGDGFTVGVATHQVDRADRGGELPPDQGQSGAQARSEEHTSELQSLMRISYAVFCLKKKKNNYTKYSNRAK